MKVGFTGTRKGMTEFQKSEVRRILTEYMHGRSMEAHHGDCIGADTDFHNICMDMWYPIVLHPSNLSTRVWNRGAIYTHEPKPPLVRDHDIVDVVDIMLAAPKGKEILRSGTWATIRYARKMGKEIHIIYPQGD